MHDDIAPGALGTQTVGQARRALGEILSGRDRRLFVVVGPCSIHDPVAAMEYARKLKALADELTGQLLIIMRVYFEKPRTTVGWKGYINDPRMDDSFHIEEGLRLARRLLVDINELGLPCGTEALDPISPQYLGDLIAWSAIGARTTESQTHHGCQGPPCAESAFAGNSVRFPNCYGRFHRFWRFHGIHQGFVRRSFRT